MAVGTIGRATEPRAIHPSLKQLAIGFVGALAFGLLAWFSVELTRGESRIAAVWLPNALALAALLRFSIKHEWLLFVALFLANVTANLIGGDIPLVAMGLAAGNMLEIAIALVLVRRWCGRHPDIMNIKKMGWFVIAATVLAPAISATIATLVLHVTGPDVISNWSRWAITDGLSMLVIAPCAMIAIDSWRTRQRPSRLRALEWSAITMIGTTLTIAIFAQTSYPFLFFVGPIVVLHAFRLGALGTAFSIIKIAVIATVFTSFGTGPINLTDGPMSAKLMVLQTFLASAFVIGIPVAAVLQRRKRIMRALDTGKRELDLLASNITDAVMRFDRNAICTYASPSVLEVLDREPSDLIGKPASAKLHPDARSEIVELERQLLEGEIEKKRITYRRLRNTEGGSPVYIEADCATIYDPETGERDGFVVSARDVTNRVELERQLVRARNHAEAAARAKSEFLANMSHEIRTPMNGVLGFAELLLQGDPNSEQKRQIELIVQSGRSMMMLLNDILDLSKIEAGHVKIDRAPVDLHKLLSECVDLHRANAERKGLRLAFDFLGPEPDGGNHWISTDSLRVRQIVLNLIGNAVKFTGNGFVRVNYKFDWEGFCVEVSDSGVGIGQERLESIFHPFTQAEGDVARRFGGTGLGLTISRQLAELLGGRIEVRSEAGVGSTFTLHLPAEPAVAESGLGKVEAEIFLDSLPHGSRILLAEDHDVNRLLVTEMLERCGQNVAVAHDGNEAISMVFDGLLRGKPYDLVLMDVQMPECDGYAATEAIRAEAIGPDLLPIIALTANAYPEDIAAARASGMQAHLAKPLDFAELARVLQRWLPTRIVDESRSTPVVRCEEEYGAAKPGRSPELVKRWLERRCEAVDAVRNAMEGGLLSELEHRERLARLVHKLAGTAAMFDEEELGLQASELERALKGDSSIVEREALAESLLETADRVERSFPQ